jgi:hypothetical protein
MALINCAECGKEISSQAQTCPHCGYGSKSALRAPIGNSILKIIVAVIIVLLAIGYLWGLFIGPIR